MTPVDFVVVLVCAVSAGFGVWRGFTKEALSLLTLLAAIWLAWRISWVVEPWLGEWAGAQEAKVWTARVVVFLVVISIGGVVSWLTRTLIKHSGLSGVDRLLGGGFGLLRGALVIGLAAIVLQFTGLDQDPWWQQARLRPYAEQVAAAVRYYAELGSQYLHERQAV